MVEGQQGSGKSSLVLGAVMFVRETALRKESATSSQSDMLSVHGLSQSCRLEGTKPRFVLIECRGLGSRPESAVTFFRSQVNLAKSLRPCVLMVDEISEVDEADCDCIFSLLSLLRHEDSGVMMVSTCTSRQVVSPVLRELFIDTLSIPPPTAKTRLRAVQFLRAEVIPSLSSNSEPDRCVESSQNDSEIADAASGQPFITMMTTLIDRLVDDRKQPSRIQKALAKGRDRHIQPQHLTLNECKVGEDVLYGHDRANQVIIEV